MIVECEFCSGTLLSDLVCREEDCGADMRVHWEMTNPDNLLLAQQVHEMAEPKPRPTFGSAEFEIAMTAFNIEL